MMEEYTPLLKALLHGLGPTPVQQVKIQVIHGRHHDSQQNTFHVEKKSEKEYYKEN